jgi:hypothetical protein
MRLDGPAGEGARCQTETPEHFQEKWKPVFRLKMRKNKWLEHSRVSAECENAPGEATDLKARTFITAQVRPTGRALPHPAAPAA